MDTPNSENFINPDDAQLPEFLWAFSCCQSFQNPGTPQFLILEVFSSPDNQFTDVRS